MKTAMYSFFSIFLFMFQSIAYGSNHIELGRPFQIENRIGPSGIKRITFDADRLDFSDGQIIFHANREYDVHLHLISYDGTKYFYEANEALWGLFVCGQCNYMTTQRISSCPRCGSTDIRVVDNWPDPS